MVRSMIRKKMDRRGFTIAETLLVIAVMSVLFALAAPNLVKIRRDLKVTRLDGTAREIFLTAQNELTDRKAAGRLGKLEEEDVIQPKEEEIDGVTRTIYYMASENGKNTMDRLTVFLSTIPGECVIYINPRSGDVTDVYYSEDTLGYGEAADLRKRLGGTDDREIRAVEGIGYYGGLKSRSAEPTKDDQEHLPEILELVNGEDLYLKLVYPRLGQAFANPEKVQAVITVRDEHSNTAVLTADGKKAADDATPAASIFADTDTNNDYTLYVLLDSMNDGCSFTELFPSLAAGDDITLTASLSYNGTALYKDAAVGSVNSLFAAKYTSDDAGGHVIRRKGVEFSRVRHLSNLRYYNQNDMAAVQVADIDFKPEVRSQTMMPVSRHLQELKEYFPPVDLNQSGFTIDGKDGAGGLHILRNFKISGAEAGLIGSCTSSVNFYNLRLLDFAVSGETYAGALIGRIHSGGKISVDNCGAYQTAAGSGSVAGGSGSPAGAQAPAGGLIGAIDGIEGNEIVVQNSFAALNVTNSAELTGGLIGKISGGSQASPVTVRNSYSSGTVMSGSEGAYKQMAGGLVGMAADAVTIIESFSSSDVYGSSLCGALVGSGSGRLQVTGSYACGSVTTANGTDSAVTYGPLATASGNGSIVSYSDCRYLSQSGNGKIADAYGNSAPEGVTACEYDVLATDGGSPVQNDPALCHPYSDGLKGKAYPFPMVTEEYYGDWPLRIQAAVKVPYSLCYYEEYSDSSWGFYGYDKNGEPADSLDYENQKVIVNAGYGILVPAGTSGVAAPDIGWGNPATMGERIEIVSVNQDLYPLPNAVQELMTHSNQLDRGINDNQANRRIYINPLFAAAMSGEVLKADASQPLQVRTEEQLRARNLINNGNWYFKQTHNISLAQADTGGLNNNTGCTYDGGGNTISNLKKPLFQKNLGTVKDLQLTWVSVSESSETAALIGLNQGLVSNCHVISGSITSVNGNAAGLVASTNGGTITGSSVGLSGSPDRVTVSGNGTYTAGLVAVTGGGAAVITDCRVMNADISNSRGSSAGLVGYNVSQISSCIVGRDVTISGSSASGFAGSNPWGGQITGCSSAGAVTSLQNGQGAAGMVVQNGGGTVTLSYSTSVVTAQNGGNASGFVDTVAGGEISFSYWNGTASANGGGAVSGFCRNLTQGTLSNSFAAGSAEASGGDATGFVKSITQYNGHVSNCYSTVEVAAPGGGKATGFTESAASVISSACNDNYWVNQVGFNENVSQEHVQGKISGISFEQLKVLSQLAVNWTWDSDVRSWTLNTSPEQSHPDKDELKGQSYPYPRISGLEYYGDWPVG
ncbi:hypothetical protein AALB39_15030 [Lachnospiraceae bacterium 54-53]